MKKVMVVIIVMATAVLSLMLMLPSSSQAASVASSEVNLLESAPTYLMKWGSFGNGNGQFATPAGAAIDPDGNLFVADQFNNRIQKFSSNGSYLDKWGSFGSGAYQFSSPYGIAVDAKGFVYVADSGNDQIKKYTNDGLFLTSWAVGGDGVLFNAPSGVAVDPWGNVFVADTVNNRIQKLNGQGTAITSWSSGSGNFWLPFGVAVDSQGNVFVADTFSHRIQKFDNNGNYLTKWGSNGSGNGQFNRPIHIAIDTDDNVYVTDASNDRVQKFSNNGTYLAKWGSEGSSNGQFNSPSGVAVDDAGDVYVVDSSNSRIQKFRPIVTKHCQLDGNISYQFGEVSALLTQDQAPDFVTQWGGPGSDPGEFLSAYDVAVDNLGNVFVVDFTDYSVTKFDSNGNFVTNFSAFLLRPKGVTVDGAGNVYVTNDHSIRKYDNDGGYIGRITQIGDLNTPSGIDVSGSTLNIADRENNRIRQYSLSGTYYRQWGTFGSGNGQFDAPTDVATDQAGNVFVVERDNARVQKFTASGSYLGKWGSFGSGDGQFNGPLGIAVSPDGAVYVADSGNNRIQKFDNDGNYLAQWGGAGNGSGLFNRPVGIELGKDGTLFVVDSQNDFVQLFDRSRCLTMYNFGYSHPLAPAPIQTGQFWHIVETGDVTVSLTLPHNNVNNAQVCRYLGGVNGSWDCDVDSASSTTTTRHEVSTFSDWAVGSCSIPGTPTFISFDYDAGWFDLIWSDENSSYEVWRDKYPFVQPEVGNATLQGTAVSALYQEYVGNSNYFYSVRSVSECASTSAGSQPAGAFHFDLQPGS